MEFSEGAAVPALCCAMAKQQSSGANPVIFNSDLVIASFILVRP
jgi:hypothetical protein